MKKSILLSLMTLFLSVIIPAQSSNDLTGFYSGKLGKNLAITISLKQTGNEINGYYHYNKNKTDIRLHGIVGTDGKIELEEYGFFEISGYWSGKLNGDKFSGKWTNGDKNKSLPFTCARIKMDETAGEPMSDKVAFGESIIELKVKTVPVPNELAKGLFKEMIDDGSIDVELEYTKDVVKKGKENPSVLFVGENIDLNSDSIPELIVYPSGQEGACTSSNCNIWIFRKDGDQFVKILSGSTGIRGYLVLDGKLNNYQDISMVNHASAIEHEYEVYSFNGKEYKLKTCITETASEDSQGRVDFTYKEHGCN